MTGLTEVYRVILFRYLYLDVYYTNPFTVWIYPLASLLCKQLEIIVHIFKHNIESKSPWAVRSMEYIYTIQDVTLERVWDVVSCDGVGWLWGRKTRSWVWNVASDMFSFIMPLCILFSVPDGVAVPRPFACAVMRVRAVCTSAPGEL